MLRVKNAKKSLLTLSILVIGGVIFVCFMWRYSYRGDVGENEVEIGWILPPKYRSFSEPSEGRIWAQEEKDGPWILFDVNGTIIKSGVNAEAISKYEDSLAYFRTDAFHDGFFDLSGDVVSSFDRSGSNEQYSFFSDGLLATLGGNGLYGFTDMLGNWVISPDYEEVGSFNEGLCVVTKGRVDGYINRSGDVVIDLKFKNALPFTYGMAVVDMDPGGCGVINKEGEWIAEPVYEASGRPGEGFLALQKDGKMGFIDSSGNIAIDFKFLGIQPGGEIINDYCFSEGLATVFDEERGRLVIDKSGDVLFDVKEIKGKLIHPFNGGFMCAYEPEEGTTILIDRNGSEYLLPRDMRTPNSRIWSMSDGFYRFFESDFLEDSNKKSGCFVIKGIKGDGTEAERSGLAPN
ncbi:MAG: WG repeat-containing protein [Synergistaceae bacterium]|nr:WG repeat-containing protein [Synergistaceae bacterium]